MVREVTELRGEAKRYRGLRRLGELVLFRYISSVAIYGFFDEHFARIYQQTDYVAATVATAVTFDSAPHVSLDLEAEPPGNFVIWQQLVHVSYPSAVVLPRR